MSRSQMPKPGQIPQLNGAGHAPSSITPTPEANHAASGLENMPASLTPDQDPNPAGLAENPHVEDPKAVQTELDQQILKDLEAKSGMKAKETLSRPHLQVDDEDLDAPSHEKPEMENFDKDNHSNAFVPKTPKNGLQVRAKQKGFYNQHRIRENDVFSIARWEDLGAWMELTDPDLERKHQLEMKEKKARK